MDDPVTVRNPFWAKGRWGETRLSISCPTLSHREIRVDCAKEGRLFFFEPEKFRGWRSPIMR